MASILDLKSKREIASQLHSSIKNIIKCANQTLAKTDRPNLVNLYFAARRFEDDLTSLATAGYDLNSIGVVMGAEFEFDWNVMKSELGTFKSTTLPAFTTALKANESILLASELGATQVDHIPLSSGVLNAVTPLVQAIVDTGFTVT